MHSQQKEAEPKLDEVIEEPIIRLLMRKDGVATDELTRLFRHVGEGNSTQRSS